MPQSPTLVSADFAQTLLRPRPVQGHKGTFGTALLICGSKDVGGCAVLAAKACLRSGVGKAVVQVPESLREIMLSTVPEAIVNIGENTIPTHLTKEPDDNYQAIAIGPGIGTAPETKTALLEEFVRRNKTPHVVDADALNLLSQQTDWHKLLPQQTILTPHLKELSRLAGKPIKEEERLRVAFFVSLKANSIVVCKGHPTFTITPLGQVFENTTGTDAIATAGSGDVLTGIIASLLAQGYSSTNTAVLGVYLHGLSGDFAAKALGHHSVIASDIIDFLPKAFLSLINK